MDIRVSNIVHILGVIKGTKILSEINRMLTQGQRPDMENRDTQQKT